MLSPIDIQNSNKTSGYDYVIVDHGGSLRPKPYRAEAGYRGGLSKGTKRGWRGPRRKTAHEAAWDYCNYRNGASLPVPATLKTANHGTVTGRLQTTHPKRAEAYRLLREAKADEGDNPAGYVYCITDGTKVKLGKSADHPQNRLKGLQTGNPRLLSLLGFKQVEDRHAAEATLHARHIDANVLGEWFEPTAAILKEFRIKGVTFSTHD